MIGVLGHNSALQGYTGPGTTLVIEMNFVIVSKYIHIIAKNVYNSKSCL